MNIAVDPARWRFSSTLARSSAWLAHSPDANRPKPVQLPTVLGKVHGLGQFVLEQPGAPIGHVKLAHQLQGCHTVLGRVGQLHGQETGPQRQQLVPAAELQIEIRWHGGVHMQLRSPEQAHVVMAGQSARQVLLAQQAEPGQHRP